MSDVARKTGRGFLVITAAKAWFLVTGAVVNLGLPTLFKLHEGQGTAAFGDYGVVINLVSIFNMVMITGTLQAVSKIVSEVPEQAAQVVWRAVKVQFAVGAPIALVYALTAPLTARAFKDPGLAPAILLSGGIILSYSFYAIFVGYFNGTIQFTRQALLDICFATLKTALIITAVVVGVGVIGAIGGFVATAIVMTVVAALWFRRQSGARGEWAEVPGQDTGDVRRSGRRIMGYMLAIMAYTFCLNFIIRTDLFLLKALASMRLEAAGLAAGVVDEASSSLSGVYTGMANVARLPYQAVIAITFVVFPIISKATFEGDREAARGYIRGTLRYGAIFIASMATVLIADRRALLGALYPEDYGAGHEALFWLALGMVGFALMYVATTILISAGRPLVALAVAGATLIAAAALNYALLTTGPVGDPMLGRAGLATCVATALGTMVTLVVIYRRFRAGIPWSTVARIAVASAVVVLLEPRLPVETLADALPGGRLVTLLVVGLKMALFVLLYYVLLIVVREFGPEDLERLKRVMQRRPKDSQEA